MNPSDRRAPQPKEWDAPTFRGTNDAYLVARLYKMRDEQRELADACLQQFEQAIRLVVSTEAQLKELGE